MVYNCAKKIYKSFPSQKTSMLNRIRVKIFQSANTVIRNKSNFGMYLRVCFYLHYCQSLGIYVVSVMTGEKDFGSTKVRWERKPLLSPSSFFLPCSAIEWGIWFQFFYGFFLAHTTHGSPPTES